MKTLSILVVLTVPVLFSCGNPGSKSRVIKSFELNYSSDTINVIDACGRKQGIWLTSKDGKDTTVYLNDTPCSVRGTTARELIKSLNARNQ